MLTAIDFSVKRLSSAPVRARVATPPETEVQRVYF